MEEINKDKVQEIATMLENLLPIVDMTANAIIDDIDLLDEALKSLQAKISHNEAALPVIIALGGNYDSSEDKCKIETLQALIALIKARVKYRDVMIKKQNQKINNQELLKLFDL